MGCARFRRGESDADGILQVLNQHPATTDKAFKVGVSVDRNKKCRRTMEECAVFFRCVRRELMTEPQCPFIHLRFRWDSRTGLLCCL